MASTPTWSRNSASNEHRKAPPVLKLVAAAPRLLSPARGLADLARQDFGNGIGVRARRGHVRRHGRHPGRQAARKGRRQAAVARRSRRPSRLALQPLQAEWDQMDGVRKQKWLQLAPLRLDEARTSSERVHERMRAVDQADPGTARTGARNLSASTRKIAPEQKKAATWESYKQLPEEQKRKLATAAVRKNAAGGAKPAATRHKSTSTPARPAPRATRRAALRGRCRRRPASRVRRDHPAGARPPAPAAPPAQQEKPVPPNWGIANATPESHAAPDATRPSSAA
jgi:hypothetical protein